jgi:hypothetical protein
MAQILLSLIVFTAALVLLVNSWKAEKRLFAATALVVLLTAGVIFASLIYQQLTDHSLSDPALVEVTLDQARPTENGVRLSGKLQNLSEQRISSVRLELVVSQCPTEESCSEIGRDRIDVVLQIPPNGGYPFNAVARITGLRGKADLRWQIEPLSVTTY